MRTPGFVLLFLILTDFSVLAQFKKGYVITNNNDSIHGYIKFEGSIINSHQCAFSTTSTGDEIQIFKPDELKAFRFIDGKFFSSREISDNGQTRLVFLEWLIQGRASLLTYSPSVVGVRYFLLTEDDSLTELFNIKNRNEFRSILNYHLKDCPSLKPKIETTAFTSKSLIKLTKEYHDRTCDTWDCVIFEDTDRKLKLGTGLIVNYYTSELLLRPVDGIEPLCSRNEIGYGLMINAHNLPLLSSKFYLSMDIMFQKSLFSYDTTLFKSVYQDLVSERINKDDRLVSTKYFRVPVNLNYRFSLKKFSPYVSLGPVFNIRYNYETYNQWLLTITFKGEGYQYKSIKPIQLGINSGIGFEYDITSKYSVSAGYGFDYCFKFFASSANDKSVYKSHSVSFSTIYRFGSKD